MKLEYPKYPDGIKTAVQSRFGGFDRSYDTDEGVLREVLNTTADRSPRLSSAPARSKLTGAEAVYERFDSITRRWWEGQGREGSYEDEMPKLAPVIEGVFDVADRIFYLVSTVDTAADLGSGGAPMFALRCAVYDEKQGEAVLSVAEAPYSRKGVRGVVFNRRLVVWIDGSDPASDPDRVVSFECTELPDGEGLMMSVSRISLEFSPSVCNVFHDITEAATYIGSSCATDGISVGDTVRVRIDGEDGELCDEFIKVRRLYFSETGEQVIECDFNERIPASSESLADLETGRGSVPMTLRLSRPVPSLEHVTVNRDRIWGTKGNEIFSSASCDPCNWYNYGGNASDAFTAQIPAVSRFSAVCSYMGSVYFFTNEGAYRMYGTTPEAFSISELQCHGCPEESASSFGCADGLVFYCSEQGPVCFDGEGSTLIAYPFGDELPRPKCALGAGGRYLFSDGSFIFSYDVHGRAWHRLEGAGACALLRIGGREAVFYSDGRAEYLRAEAGEERIEADSFAEFAPFTEGGIYGVLPVEFTVRAKLARDARLSLSVACGRGDWQQILKIEEDGEHVRSVHFLPRTRADSYRLRLDGHGEWQVTSIARSYIYAPRSH